MSRQLRQAYKDLQKERDAHQRTRQQLQSEIDRIWRLVPSHYIALMGVYPPLRKLLHVLAEAADHQDPARGAPIEDTMRVEYVAAGENASTSATEAGVLTHRRSRHNVSIITTELEHLRKEFTKELEAKSHDLAKLIESEEYEYHPPSGECECGCGRLIFQSTDGRPRRFHSSACRKRASRKVVP